jgi:hypothetical protein
MWLTPIVLDADMTASAVLARLAAHGLWIEARDPAARARIEPLCNKSGRAYGELAALLHRPACGFGAAIRQQVGTSVVWFARPADDVLRRVRVAAPEQSLGGVLELSGPGDEVGRARDAFNARLGRAVVIEHGEPQSVWVDAISAADELLSIPSTALPPASAPDLGTVAGNVLGTVGRSVRMPNHWRAGATDPVVVWPRLKAPNWVAAGTRFDVVAGLSTARRDYRDNDAFELLFSEAEPALELTVELSVGPELQVLGESSVPLRVERDTVDKAEARFSLTGLEPTNAQRAFLTSLEIRYLLKGRVCGTASLPLAVLPALKADQPSVVSVGTEWTEVPAATSSITASARDEAPDLTLEIFKPDGHAGTGTYCCRLLSPHRLQRRPVLSFLIWATMPVRLRSSRWMTFASMPMVPCSM